MLIRNIENKIKLAAIISIGAFVTSIVIVLIAMFFAVQLVHDERKNIYVLDGSTPLLAQQTGQEVNLEVECRSHINQFHTLFFTMPPDDDFMKHNMEKAMYLVDESGLRQLNNLKEKGYFNSIMATSATVTIKTDSILMDMTNMSFEYHGIQRIERQTSVAKRQIITTGTLRQVPRTFNNPHGLIIGDWKTILNKDLDYQQKKNF